MKNLREKTLLGFQWTTLDFILSTLIQIIQLVILSRILTPIDFGIVSIGNFFATLGNSVFALGLGPSLIQKEGSIKDYLNSAWTYNLLISLIAYLLLSLCIYFFSKNLFESDEATLASLFMVSIVLISGFNNIKIVYFQRLLKLKPIFLLNFIPKLFSFCFIIYLSFSLKNYWALIIGVLTEYLIRLFLSYILLPYFPKLDWNKSKFKILYNFGGWIQLKNFTNWFGNYFDVIIIGSYLSLTDLGLYNRAQTVGKLPLNLINSIVNSVSFPMYSRLKDDSIKINQAFSFNFQIILLILAPIILSCLLYSKSFIFYLLGEKWIQITPVFKFLVLGFCLQAIFFSILPLFRAIGLPKIEFQLNFAKTLSNFIIIIPLVLYFGLLGVSFSFILVMMIIIPFFYNHLLRKLKIDHKTLLGNFLIFALSILFVFLIFIIFVDIDFVYSFFRLFILLSSSIILNYLFLYFFYLVFKLGPGFMFSQLRLKFR